MPASYTYGAEPSSSAIDFVRFKTGDTVADDWFLADEEIMALLGAESPLYACASACEAIAALFARRTEKSAGRLRIASQQRSVAYLSMARTLRAQAARQGVIPFVGGLSYAQKENVLSDTDYVEPSFTRDMDDSVNIDPRVSPGQYSHSDSGVPSP